MTECHRIYEHIYFFLSYVNYIFVSFVFYVLFSFLTHILFHLCRVPLSRKQALADPGPLLKLGGEEQLPAGPHSDPCYVHLYT